MGIANISDNRYSSENLCGKFIACEEAREMNFGDFNRYCAGNPEACINNVLVSALESGIYDIGPILEKMECEF